MAQSWFSKDNLVSNVVAAAYQYISDDGTLYQVVLPSDFAAALNYVSATGREPFLPDWISPRYATYRTLAGIIINSAVICTPFNSINPPTSIEIGTQAYALKSSYGEQRNSFIYNNIVTLVGPQGPTGSQGPEGPTGATGATGPTGPSGVLSISSNTLAANTGLSAGVMTDLCSLSLAAGSYILAGNFSGILGGAASTFEAALYNSTDGSYIVSGYQSQVATNDSHLALLGTLVITAAKTITLRAQIAAASSGSIAIGTSSSSFGPPTNLIAVKYA